MATSVCDVLSDLEELLEGRAIKPSVVDAGCDIAASFIPKTKENVCYIVGAVLFNDKGDVLMIQEAKSSCRGQWYLPMGRLEKGESLLEGAQREVLEESGLHFVPTTLLCVEVGCGSWYRFIYTGKVTGGKLKSTSDGDSESLQAKWMKYEEVVDARKRTITIRAGDIFKLIKLGHRRYSQSDVTKRIPKCVGSCNPHKQLLLRLILLQNDTEGKKKVLVNSKEGDHFPLGVIGIPDFSLDVALSRILQAAFVRIKQRPQIFGVLAVEYSGKPPRKNDGVCFTILAQSSSQELQLLKDTGFHWLTVPPGDTLDKLKSRLENVLFIPLLQI
ncbi:8-oxo-dGDP phosphatase NUDT18-like [Liolophura sinensis]|uniref:8-oxo-dGDP phosphatase NUDT18-like n=1 Tax=Liolophura sinensis TaxID=3198878 RepID=UPI003159144D